ncbi:hypothetical protein [Actinacidiphila epipremni]|uniref:G domain-containing protein n=1 Tax=Actinacidiphila epipremni TaxID=2053013 RepID=A0ABX0ZGF0_9ACTN|nr:hypothetical protein [Actinacidiphila epipremni]NJP42890.1 hypothetical protein [Actinacidiphila epipremni]
MDAADTGDGEDARELAERVALLADRAGADLFSTLIRQSLRRARSPVARVCFVGGTNTGKSLLVNSLAGAALLPVSVRPSDDPPTLVRPYTAQGAPDDGYRVVTVQADAGDGWLAEAGLELVDTQGWDVWVADSLDSMSGAAPGGSDPGRQHAYAEPQSVNLASAQRTSNPSALNATPPSSTSAAPAANAAPPSGTSAPTGPNALAPESGSQGVAPTSDRPHNPPPAAAGSPPTATNLTAPHATSARLVADCDALVVVIQAERALTSTEQAAVRALAGEPHCPPLLVVVTALDRLADGPEPAAAVASGDEGGANGEDSEGGEVGEVMRRVRQRVRTLAPEALVLAGPGVPVSGERLAQLRGALVTLTGARLRLSHRGERRLLLLGAACALVADAARRAVADAGRADDPLRARALEVWHAARESAAYEWVGLAAALDRRRAGLLARVGAEAGRRRAACVAALAAELAQAPDTPAFVRLRILPQTDVAVREFQEWVAGEITAAFTDDTRWLRAALSRTRPGTDPVPAPAGGDPAAAAVPVAAPYAVNGGADDGGWDASWVPEVLGQAVESVLAPLAPEVLARAVGAAADALLADLVERAQERRLDRTADALERTVAAAFAGHLARVEDRLDQLHAQLLARAQERDEQWWHLHSAALAARPDSARHWHALLAEATSLGDTVAARLAAREEV